MYWAKYWAETWLKQTIVRRYWPRAFLPEGTRGEKRKGHLQYYSQYSDTLLRLQICTKALTGSNTTFHKTQGRFTLHWRMWIWSGWKGGSSPSLQLKPTLDPRTGGDCRERSPLLFYWTHAAPVFPFLLFVVLIWSLPQHDIQYFPQTQHLCPGSHANTIRIASKDWMIRVILCVKCSSCWARLLILYKLSAQNSIT